MASKFVGLLALLMVALSSVGCHSARYVQKDTEQGVVSIPRNTNRFPNYRNQANELMLEHFPEGYVIEREEEVVIGETTHFHEGSQDQIIQASNEVTFANGTTDARSTTVPKTEYRIYYRRRN